MDVFRYNVIFTHSRAPHMNNFNSVGVIGDALPLCLCSKACKRLPLATENTLDSFDIDATLRLMKLDGNLIVLLPLLPVLPSHRFFVSKTLLP